MILKAKKNDTQEAKDDTQNDTNNDENETKNSAYTNDTQWVKNNSMNTRDTKNDTNY